MRTRFHRQGRTGAGERVFQRAHARRLLLTLAEITRQLGGRLTSRAAQAEYRAVERTLLRLAGEEEA
ncbi:MAG: hypothetical protein ACOZE5_12970 [Verrucomicrobiota bacterium]